MVQTQTGSELVPGHCRTNPKRGYAEENHTYL